MKNILSGCLHKNIDSIGGAWIGIIVWGFLCVCTNSYGQALRGTTGLLHAPTADMQQDKTFMFGGNVLDIIPLHYYDFDVNILLIIILTLLYFHGWKWGILVH